MRCGSSLLSSLETTSVGQMVLANWTDGKSYERKWLHFPDGNWGPWSDFTTCSVSCGNGTKRRERHCNNPPKSGNGTYCSLDGSRGTEVMPCSLQSCSGTYWTYLFGPCIEYFWLNYMCYKHTITMFMLKKNWKHAVNMHKYLSCWLREETHVPKVVSLNPRTIYWVDIFSHLVVKILMCVWRDENNWKRGRGWPI